jgi:hypothetical protein
MWRRASDAAQASLERRRTSTGSVFGSLAKLQWAILCGLPIDSQFVSNVEYGPREHLRLALLLQSLPRLPLIRLKICLTELHLCNIKIAM